MSSERLLVCSQLYVLHTTYTDSAATRRLFLRVRLGGRQFQQPLLFYTGYCVGYSPGKTSQIVSAQLSFFFFPDKTFEAQVSSPHTHVCLYQVLEWWDTICTLREWMMMLSICPNSADTASLPLVASRKRRRFRMCHLPPCLVAKNRKQGVFSRSRGRGGVED